MEKLVPEHNRRFAKTARKPTDAHRRLGPRHRLESILSVQAERVVSNDYVVRFANRHFQLLPPVYPGERGGRVVIEERLDGSLAIRFGTRDLPYREIAADGARSGEDKPSEKAERTRAKPSGRSCRPAADHPWRNGKK